MDLSFTSLGSSYSDILKDPFSKEKVFFALISLCGDKALGWMALLCLFGNIVETL